METLTCNCGKEILLLPDLKAMHKAIENHVNEHAKIARKHGLIEANIQVEKIKTRLDLTKKTLVIAKR